MGVSGRIRAWSGNRAVVARMAGCLTAGRGAALLGRAAVPALASAMALGVAGCGTDLRGLLVEDGRLAMEAQMLTMDAPPGTADTLQRAEAEKADACRFLYQAASDRIASGEPDLGEAVLSDLGELLVRVVPVGQVEDCATAQRRYAEAVEALRQRFPDRAPPAADH